MNNKPTVYLISNVFLEIASNDKISQDIRHTIKKLWDKLSLISILKFFDGRFPTEAELKKDLDYLKPDILGCHLSHPISSESLKNSDIFAIATSTAGYNHIQRPEADDIIITHTPGVLHHTVADYTIALIMANLRNIIDLHNYVWKGEWKPDDKWDLDQNLSFIINNKILGIVGVGEIGSEVIKRLYPWGLKIIYFDTNRRQSIEEQYPNLEYKVTIEDVFKEADIVSLHIPLNKHTENIINRDKLKLMKKGALLINTARGGVINFKDLLELLESRDIHIDLSFDVFPEEPIDTTSLERLKKIKKERPDIRMVLMPHNASADADTRGKMDIIFLEDIIKLVESSNIEDLKDIHIIPEQKKQLLNKKWKILKYWENK